MESDRSGGEKKANAGDFRRQNASLQALARDDPSHGVLARLALRGHQALLCFGLTAPGVMALT